MLLSRQFKNLCSCSFCRFLPHSPTLFCWSDHHFSVIYWLPSCFCLFLCVFPPTLCHFFSPCSLQCHLPVTRGQLHYGDPAAAQELQLLHHIPSGDRHLWVQPGTVQPPPQGEGRRAARTAVSAKATCRFLQIYLKFAASDSKTTTKTRMFKLDIYYCYQKNYLL